MPRGLSTQPTACPILAQADTIGSDTTVRYRGDRTCLHIAKTVCELGRSRLTQAVVLAHPSSITVEDINGVNIPIAILGAELDTITPPELIKQFEQVLAAKSGVDSYVQIFPNVSHGWTLRYDTEDPKAVKAAEEAHQILDDWFDKHLK